MNSIELGQGTKKIILFLFILAELQVIKALNHVNRRYDG